MERYCHSDKDKLLHIMWEVGILLGLCTSSHFSLHIKGLLLPNLWLPLFRNLPQQHHLPLLMVTLRSVSPCNWHLNSASSQHE